MALRNPGRLLIDKWRGLDSFTHENDITPEQWLDSNNVVVNAKGDAEALRSPKAFGSALTPYLDSDSSSPDSSSSPSSSFDSSPDDGPILSMDEYKRNAGHVAMVDRGGDTYSIDSSGTVTGRRSDQAGDPWTSVNVNDRFLRTDGNEFIQFLSSFAHYRVGIDPPATAPTISYTADDSSDSISDSCEIETSLQVSYAYKNSTTGHIGQASPISNVLGPTEDDLTLRIPVVASTQPGVDKIVFFITLDGGSIPYLALECGTDTVYEVGNSSGNVDIPLCAYDVDTLTPETIYNVPPPVDATHIFRWKDRIILLRGRFIQYSAWEVAYAGNPWECYPSLNQIMIPNKADTGIGGLSTQLGALIFGKEDSYILSGYPSDKVSSPNNTLAVTEHAEPLNWQLGIYEDGKGTAVLTQFGVIWLDQNKRLRNWDLKSFPVEIGVGLRTELDAMSGEITARWFQHGKNSGVYVLRNASKVLFITVYQDTEGKIHFGYGKSNLATDATAVVTYSTGSVFLFGTDDQVYKFLDPDLRGDGWASGTEIFFKLKLGNQGNFSYFHSCAVEGNLDGVTMKVNGNVIPLEEDIDTDGTLYSVVDVDGRRALVEFRFNRDDAFYRSVDMLQVFQKNKKRII